jgi:DNA (cytosine-5)-methyltransferase 1
MSEMKLLDLFSGVGGFSLGLEKAGFKTIAFCEIEKYPQKVLAKHWPTIPIASDVTKLTYKDGVLYDDGNEIYRGSINAICGGFPCQDISVAGNQKGIGEGTRSGLWSECARLLGEIRPAYAIFENVTALLSGEQGRWFQRVLFDISEVGYDAEWHCIPASELGAHHHRDRVWIIAYPGENCISQYRQERQDNFYGRQTETDNTNGSEFELGSSEVCAVFPHTNGTQCKRGSLPIGILAEYANVSKCGGWEVEPGMGRVANGIPDSSHRLKCLGNAVVPQIPEIIGKAIMEAQCLK